MKYELFTIKTKKLKQYKVPLHCNVFLCAVLLVPIQPDKVPATELMTLPVETHNRDHYSFY